MIQLTKNFSMLEMCDNSHGVNNVPAMQELVALTVLCAKILQPAREKMGIPIKINSGFRNFELNSIVGGVSNSQHLKGEAADICCSDNKKLFILIQNEFQFDQLIWEKGNKDRPQWIHVSYNRLGLNRQQVIYNR